MTCPYVQSSKEGTHSCSLANNVVAENSKLKAQLRYWLPPEEPYPSNTGDIEQQVANKRWHEAWDIIGETNPVQHSGE